MTGASEIVCCSRPDRREVDREDHATGGAASLTRLWCDRRVHRWRGTPVSMLLEDGSASVVPQEL